MAFYSSSTLLKLPKTRATTAISNPPPVFFLFGPALHEHSSNYLSGGGLSHSHLDTNLSPPYGFVLVSWHGPCVEKETFL